MATIKKAKGGGSLTGLNASNKRDKGIDLDGAWRKVQKKTLAGAKETPSLTRDKELGATKMKSGGKLAKAKDGKWMQKAAASIKRRGTEGKCTPITKPGCTGKAKALAKTFKKIAKARKGK